MGFIGLSVDGRHHPCSCTVPASVLVVVAVVGNKSRFASVNPG